MALPYASLRAQIVQAAQRMAAEGLVIGTSGNVSARVRGEERFLITPSSLPYPALTPADIVLVAFEGEVLSDGRAPSVEGSMHCRVYREREDVGAVLHTHSPHATALAALHMPIPPFLEELTLYIGGPVEVAAYAASATEELGEHAVQALGDRAAALLANHGPVCVGKTLERAYDVARLVERAAQIYLLARSVGTPHALPEASLEMQRMFYAYARTQGLEEA